MKLGSTGIPCEYDLETTLGPEAWLAGETAGADYLDLLAPAAVAFVARGLEAERMRLV